ncbi:hypothetical protein FRC00_001386 [Tulasnella sp. 408]|nr:hypothetical protein FRC00_001386 [Tulasnella sp. 408]
MTTARFISPFMTNGNIEEYLASAPGPVTDALRLKLLKGSLSGLVYLHSLDPPVCHADIKPVMTGSLPYPNARSDQQIILALAFKKTPMELADLDLGDDQLTTLLTKCWDINPSTRPSAAECLPYLHKTETEKLQFPETVDDSISAFTHYENYGKGTTSTAATIRQSSANWSADPTIARRFAQYREASSTPVGRLKLVLGGYPSVGPASDAEEQAGLVEALLSATSRVPQPPQTRAPQDLTPTPRPAVRIARSNDTNVANLSLPSRTAAPRRDEDASATPGASDTNNVLAELGKIQTTSTIQSYINKYFGKAKEKEGEVKEAAEEVKESANGAAEEATSSSRGALGVPSSRAALSLRSVKR